MGGVAGHAGLFSTADDLARYCQMLLNGGILDGKRILSAQTVARMTAPIVVSEDGATRGLGWDMNSSFSSNRGELFPLGSFGHTGFTGTSVFAPALQPSRLRQSKTPRLKRFDWRKIFIRRKSSRKFRNLSVSSQQSAVSSQ
jgi:hypothetical protein